MSKLGWMEIVRTVFEIVSGLAALIFIYQYFQTVEQPERQRIFLLLGLVAVAVLLALIRRRLLNWAVSTARTAVRFIRQNAVLVGSLLLASGLAGFLLQRAQDTVVAGATVGLVLTAAGIGIGAVRLLALTRPSSLGLSIRSGPRELRLSFLGKTADQVGSGPGRLGPDGHVDAAFALQGRWGQRQQITQIDLVRIDSEGKRLGEHWTSSEHARIWQLGVVGRTQEGTVALSRGPWTVNADEEFTFLLYASDWVPPQAWFTEGQWYEVLVQHEGGPCTVRTCLEGS